MTLDLKRRRKSTFLTHRRQIVFIKNPFESEIHVLTKAFIWALYLPDYPFLSVEIKARNRYKPDVVQFDDEEEPVFWGEAGQVSLRKIRTLPVSSSGFTLKRAHNFIRNPPTINLPGLG